MNLLIQKIKRKLIRIRLQPIRIFCFHHVCAIYDASHMYECDWMQIDEFKSKVISMLQDGVEFVSLTTAYKHICNDWFRCNKYAVLTFDDGYASLKEILPWLEKKNIPVTLFINGKYLDGKSYRENLKEKYLTYEELFALSHPFIEIGSHGWEHIDACDMKLQEFKDSVNRNRMLLQTHPKYIPFYAYTYGKHILEEDEFLKAESIIPIYVSGEKNYNNCSYLDRELLRVNN